MVYFAQDGDGLTLVRATNEEANQIDQGETKARTQLADTVK